MSNQAEAMMQDQIEGAQSENEALRDAMRWREPDEEPREGQEVLAVIYPYNNTSNRMNIVHAIYRDGKFLDQADGDDLHPAHYWMPAPAIPGA